MAKQLELRRGTTQANNLFTGATGEVTMDTDTKALRVHDGDKVGGYMIDTLIAFQVPTQANNYTWYRKYASGWVEQGGTLQTAANSLTFPIEMADTNYQWYANPVPQDFGNFRKLAATRTTTGLTNLSNIFGTSSAHASAAVWDAGTFWEVKGVAA